MEHRLEQADEPVVGDGVSEADARRKSDGADDGSVHIGDVPVEVVAESDDDGSGDAADARSRYMRDGQGCLPLGLLERVRQGGRNPPEGAETRSGEGQESRSPCSAILRVHLDGVSSRLRDDQSLHVCLDLSEVSLDGFEVSL